MEMGRGRMDRDKSIFITGAASGIGRETALYFARKGWFVGIYDVNEAGLLKLQSEIREENCCLGQMDVRDVDAVVNGVKAFVEKTGGAMNVLFNNAGVASMGLNEHISIEDQHRVVDINFKGILNCIHASLPYLKRTRDARIINMCSASAIYGIPEMMVYSATKHAVKALTEALDIELERYGIVVSDIMVPYVRTPLVTDAEVKASSIEKMGVHVEPEQVAAAVWDAAHGHRLHWKITGMMKLLLFLFWAFPFARRPIIKALTTSPNDR
jgi:NAD(P)-dependent dehydrogenase (short-subunit alcohol dehydrogenase family)